MAENYSLHMHPKAKEGAVVKGDSYRFTVLTDRLIRLEYQAEGRFTDEATQTVICRDFPVPEFRIVEKDGLLEIVTDKLHLYYDKELFSPQGLSIQLKEGFHVHGSNWSFGDRIWNLKGTARTLDGANGSVELESGLLSRGGFTVLDDSCTALLTDDQWIKPRTHNCFDLYFWGYGHDYIDCLRDFYRLSGQTPLLPRFTFGNWWSRYHKYTEESYLALMEEFQTRDIPFSVAVIDMDWHLTDIPKQYGSGWTGYTWNPAFFPDPKRFLDKLHDMGLHTTLNVHPADGVRAHEEAYSVMAEELGADSAHEDKIPFEATDRKFMDAYFKYLHHPHEAIGVDFWWIDWQQGKRSAIAGIDPLWMLNHLHFLDNGREGRQPLTFSRYAGIGSHRYPIGFSGDTYSTWESLDFQPYFTATASNVGYSWWSHDIGGHMGGCRDDELAVRWMQFGVFSPIMRLHSTSNPFYSKEPWNYGTDAEQIMVRFLRLRHKLVPYLYSMNYLTHLAGMPLMQPMFYRHDVQEAYDVPNEYWFGTQMIVCPITKPADRESLLAEFDAWLPEGEYFDIFTGQLYKGGRKLKLYRDLASIPVLVPTGGIIPMAGGHIGNRVDNPKELELWVYNGADGSFDMYEDNGADSNAQPIISHFRFTSGKSAVLTIELDGDTEHVIPEERIYDIRICGVEEPKEVLLDSGLVKLSSEYDAVKRQFCLRFCGYRQHMIQVHFTLETGDAVGRSSKSAIYDILQRAQIAYNLKADIYYEVCRERDVARLLGKLSRMEIGEKLYCAIVEQVVSEH